MNYIYLILLWAVFYASHSFLASGKLKRKLESKLGKAYKWYRLFYSLFSLLFFRDFSPFQYANSRKAAYTSRRSLDLLWLYGCYFWDHYHRTKL